MAVEKKLKQQKRTHFIAFYSLYINFRYICAIKDNLSEKHTLCRGVTSRTYVLKQIYLAWDPGMDVCWKMLHIEGIWGARMLLREKYTIFNVIVLFNLLTAQLFLWSTFSVWLSFMCVSTVCFVCYRHNFFFFFFNFIIFIYNAALYNVQIYF